MNSLLIYSLAALISFAGLITGMFLTYSNKDELKPGRNYFVFAQKIIWAGIIAVTGFAYGLNWLILGLIFVFVALPFFDSKQIKTPSMYLMYGIIFFLSTKSVPLLAVNSSLIFLFGLPSGTLLKLNEKSSIEKGFVLKLARHLGFFVWLPLIILF
jgi:hypothetical protein